MTDWSIWAGASPPSGSIDQSTDVQHYTLGTVFQVTAPGLSAKAIRFYFLPGAWNPLGAPTKVALYDFSSQALLASAVYSGGVPGAPGWTDVPISPVSLSTSSQYVAAVLYPNGYYPFHSQFFHLHTQTTGPLTAPGDDSPPVVNNGRFVVATDLAFPTDSFGNAAYFADVVVSDAPAATHETVSWATGYTVRSRSSSSWQTGWVTRTRAAGAWQTGWTARARAAGAWATAWTTRARVATAWQTAWTSRVRAAAAWQTRWTVRVRVTSTWPTSYVVVGRRAAAWHTSWTTGAPVVEIPVLQGSTSPMAGALIHVCREDATRPTATRNAQGAKVMEAYLGPWVACRFMERGVTPKQRRDDGAGAVDRRYEILVDALDESGVAYELRASMRLFVHAPPVTDPTGWLVEVDGDPERLNDGVEVIGWMGSAARVEDSA